MRMEVKVSLEELRTRSLFLSTPMYGGVCHGLYHRSVHALGIEMLKLGVNLSCHYLFNESLITRARNYCADEFLRSNSTHMLFIDSDIGFMPQDVIMMLALMSEESDYDVMCGPYPKKNISWEKIVAAVNQGKADEDPNVLEQFVGDFVFNALPTSDGRIPLDRPAEILEGGTGFMMIRRSAFELYDKKFPEMRYRPDHVRNAMFDGSREIMAYFMDPICPETKRHLSEDYFFCQNVRKAGGRVWLCPWMRTEHVGTYSFGGSLPALASINAHATADVDKLTHTRKRKKEEAKKAAPPPVVDTKDTKIMVDPIA